MPYPESRTPGRREVQEAKPLKEAEPDPDGADGEGSNHPAAVPDYVTAADGSDGEHDRHHEPQTEHNRGGGLRRTAERKHAAEDQREDAGGHRRPGHGGRPPVIECPQPSVEQLRRASCVRC